MTMSRRSLLAGAPALLLGGCFDEPCEERNPAQKAFLNGLHGLAKPALASSNPLQVEEAARRSLDLAARVGPFDSWCGTLTRIEGNADNVAITLDVGRHVSLYAFNDWALGLAGTVAGSLTDLFTSRSRPPPPPGLSEAALAALKTLRLGERVALSGRLGEIAGAGLFDLSRLFGKSDDAHRLFLLAPRFVARIESLAAQKKL